MRLRTTPIIGTLLLAFLLFIGVTATSCGSGTTLETTLDTGVTTTTVVSASSDTTTALDPLTTTAAATAPATGVGLKIVGPSGTKELSLVDLQAMPATTGWGGWKNKLDKITGPSSYQGVLLSDLVKLVGGGTSVTILASDGYGQTLTAAQLTGQMDMYAPSTGASVAGVSEKLRLIIAYSKDGAALDSEHGPLCLAFVSEAKDQVTDGAAWVRMVAEIDVEK
jgi:hypothetical protein